MRDPDGHGWHLDRARFDAWLRHTAVARGAMLLMPLGFFLLDAVTRVGRCGSRHRAESRLYQRHLQSMPEAGGTACAPDWCRGAG